jgi:ubiquitin-activating enzyme E1
MGAIEAIPSNPQVLLKNDRYDPYRRVFGNAQVEAMHRLRYFLLGAGALGCEILKNWAMMGVATEGKITLTDMDQIEKSNLCRQFLFRNKDIGTLKSVAAANAVKEMNNKIQIEAQSNRVGPESSSIYNDVFYQGLSGVCNALDNVETRLFSDRMCVFYKKPMLESGTLGPKSNFQIVIPYLTESYGSTQDPPEKSIPQCTLHHFPSNINHCCMWARDIFNGFFEKDPNILNRYLTDPNMVEDLVKSDQGEIVNNLQTLKILLKDNPIQNYHDCVHWAREKFEDLFNYKIRDLLHTYPEDYITDSNVPFWSGHKRAPNPLIYDPNNEFHAQFILHASNILARIYDIQPTGDPIQMAAQLSFPDWIPSNPQIQENDDDDQIPHPPGNVITVESALQIDQELIPFKNRSPVKPEEFDKDNETNEHIDFVAAAANLRALNYRINPESKLEIKRIAGKIIPAISTTTAMICGFVALEMYKVHSIEPKPLEAFRSGFINLAISLYAISEPAPCTPILCPANNIEYTIWDNWLFEGDLTVGELIQQAESQYNVSIEMLSVGTFLLYASFQSQEVKQKRLISKISELIVEKGKMTPLAEGQNLLSIVALCVDKNGNDIETPPFILKIK